MSRYYLREMGVTHLVREIGDEPVRVDPLVAPSRDNEVVTPWFEIWDGETDEVKFTFEGEDAEKKAKEKLRSLKGGKTLAGSAADSGDS